MKTATKRIIVLFIFGLFWGMGITQLAYANGGVTNWQTFTNGNKIYDLAIEGTTLWAATEGGVVKWDMTAGTYVKYTNLDGLGNIRVNTVAIDGAGNKWFGTHGGGVTKFNGTTWTTYTTADGLAGDYVYDIAIDGAGNIWFATHGGASEYSGGTFTNYTASSGGLASNNINTIAFDSAGNIWFGTDGSGVSKFDGVTGWTTYTSSATALTDDTVYTINVDGTGNIWIGTDSGITKISGSTWTTYTTANGLADNAVHAITFDGSLIWFGTEGGVSEFDGSGGWTNYTTAGSPLVDNFVYAIAIDSAHTKWIGTFNKLSKFSAAPSWMTLVTTDGPVDNSIRAVFVDSDKSIWFGTNCKGISKFDGATWVVLNGMVDDCINDIAEDASGNIWVSTWGGASKFNGTIWTDYTTTDGLASNLVYAVASAGTTIWMGTSSGVSKLVGSTFTNYTTADGLANNSVRDVAIDSAGNIWFVTWGGGVSKFDGGTGWTTYTTADGLPSNTFYAVMIDNTDTVWVGSSGGISAFDGSTWTTYTTADGLASNYVLDIAMDGHSTIWAATNNGVGAFDGTAWINYATSDGLVADNSVYGVAAGNDDALWFGTTGGVSKLVRYTNSSIPGTNFIHTSTADNVSGDYTKLDDPAINGDPNANVFITHNQTPNGVIIAPFHDYALGVWYSNSTSQWNIFNEDGSSPLPADRAFNVLVPASTTDTFVHTAASGNIAYNYTLIDNPATNNNPNAMLLITQNWNPGGSSIGTYNDHPVGVWYSKSAGKWSVFNQDIGAMPTGAGFNVTVPATTTDVFVHTATPANTIDYATFIDHPLTNNRPGAILLVTQNWNPGGSGGTYNPHHIGVGYDPDVGKWAVFNEDSTNIPANASFNVAVILHHIYLPLVLK